MRILLTTLTLFISTLLIAQAPALIPYQAIARDASGQPLANTNVNARFTIHDGSATGASVWQELQTVNTSTLGLFTAQLGSNVPLTGVNWASGAKFMQVELDLGNGFLDLGTQQMLSVPYALYSSYASSANTALNGVPAGGTNGQILTNCDGLPTWTTNGECPGTIANLICSNAVNTGVLIVGQSSSNTNTSIPYTGGNGGVYNSQSIASSGVTGLTATLNAGYFSVGSGSLVYTISGTPSSSGECNFAVNIGGQSCVFSRQIELFGGTVVSIYCNLLPFTTSAADQINDLIIPINYIGGNGGSYAAQTVNSSGVNGLTATISGGSFNNGSGTIPVSISGQPSGAGIANFLINLGGRTCTLSLNLAEIGTPTTCGSPNVHNPNLTYGSVTDQEGNVYKTIFIGAREWMAENLNTSIYRNGASIPTNLDDITWSSTTNGAWAYANNEPDNACPYGKLYNWYACMDSRGLCPTGWHIPSLDEWSTLAYATDFAGIALKSVGTIQSGTGLWYESIISGSNNWGFSAIPGGIRNVNGSFGSIGYSGNYWSSSIGGPVYSLVLGYNDPYAFLYDNSMESEGLSVRCLRD